AGSPESHCIQIATVTLMSPAIVNLVKTVNFVFIVCSLSVPSKPHLSCFVLQFEHSSGRRAIKIRKAVLRFVKAAGRIDRFMRQKTGISQKKGGGRIEKVCKKREQEPPRIYVP